MVMFANEDEHVKKDPGVHTFTYYVIVSIYRKSKNSATSPLHNGEISICNIYRGLDFAIAFDGFEDYLALKTTL